MPPYHPSAEVMIKKIQSALVYKCQLGQKLDLMLAGICALGGRSGCMPAPPHDKTDHRDLPLHGESTHRASPLSSETTYPCTQAHFPLLHVGDEMEPGCETHYLVRFSRWLYVVSLCRRRRTTNCMLRMCGERWESESSLLACLLLESLGMKLCYFLPPLPAEPLAFPSLAMRWRISF